ncbi:hypothetical protein AAG747_27930 [Rapidithrix thailandica]|uniref:Uncharacterized protein n=1 Tax=Rapidithrix thailandica TaxID=413964 RepID=A0AAW9S6B0_9BACT
MKGIAKINQYKQPKEVFIDNRYNRAHHWTFAGGACIAGFFIP